MMRRNAHADIAKPVEFNTIITFLETEGYTKNALDKRLLANRQYEAISRRPGEILQDFFAAENTACGDAVQAGVGIDRSKRP